MSFKFALKSLSGLSLAALSALAFQACGRSSEAQLTDAVSAATSEKIGLLFASHGDIDNPDTELEDYIKTSFQKNVGIPLPMWSRKLIEDPAYRLSVKTVRSQYDVIGPTRYYANSLKQIDAINEEFKTMLPNAKAYVGFNFTKPFIDDTLEQMKRDGVTKIIVVNKGAQFSYASSGENMEDVLKYLKKHPEYDVEAVGVAWYAHDNRFTDVMASSLREDIAKSFPNTPANDVCILVGSHGLPMWLINTGDSAITQMKQSVIELRKKMPEYKIYHGFLNDDFFPGAKWIAPKAIDLAPQLVADGCKNVALDGRLSFTTHHRATLFDMNVEAADYFAKESAKLKAVDSKNAGIRSVLLPNFDENKEHARLIAEITAEAAQYKGPVIPLKKKGQKALEPNSVGKPGMLLPGVTYMNDNTKDWSAAPVK
jgi:ferrochelatase